MSWQIRVVREPEASIAEISYRGSYRGELWASVIDGGGGGVFVEMCPRSAPSRESDEWRLDYDDAMKQLRLARERLASG